jgi:tetratricopeptide (TPR) repeat protein
MSRRFLALLATSAALLFAAPAVVRGEGDDAPKPEKPKTDDTSIFKDWGLCKQRGAKHNRERAEFWTGKGTAGKDLMWLGRMWARGETYPKAAATFEAFLEWKPPAGDEKAIANNLTNRETARGALIEVWFNAREFEKAVAAAQKFREEFPSSAVASDTFTDEGRAQRMLGDDAKALAAFEQAASKQFRALADIVDLHLTAGEPDKATAALEKYGGSLEKQADKVKWLKEAVAAIGSPAPGLDVAASVSKDGATVPTAYDRATVFFHWSVQSAGVDKKLAQLELIRLKNQEKMNVIGVATYKKYNVETMKIEEGLTPEQEVAGVTKLMSQSPERIPPCALVPQAFLDAAKIKWDGQLTIVDAEGKLRWMRISESKPYDFAVIEKAIEKISAPK